MSSQNQTEQVWICIEKAQQGGGSAFFYGHLEEGEALSLAVLPGVSGMINFGEDSIFDKSGRHSLPEDGSGELSAVIRAYPATGEATFDFEPASSDRNRTYRVATADPLTPTEVNVPRSIALIFDEEQTTLRPTFIAVTLIVNIMNTFGETVRFELKTRDNTTGETLNSEIIILEDDRFISRVLSMKTVMTLLNLTHPETSASTSRHSRTISLSDDDPPHSGQSGGTAHVEIIIEGVEL